MKTLQTGTLAAVLLSLSGCITFLTEIHVRTDGSGTLVQTMTMNPQAMKGALDAFAKGMGASGGSGEVKETKEQKTPFSPAELAEKTKDLGEGVTFVSADEIKTPAAEGVRVTYAFRDINTLYVNPKPGAAMGMEGAGRSGRNAMTFRFERKGDRSILTAVLPPNAETKKEASLAAPSDIDEQQLALIKQMFKGMHLGLTVEVDGRITSTTSAFRSGNRVTLFDLDFDPLLEKPESLKDLNAGLTAAMGDDAKTAAALSKIPGLKIDPKPEVQIEFAAR